MLTERCKLCLSAGSILSILPDVSAASKGGWLVAGVWWGDSALATVVSFVLLSLLLPRMLGGVALVVAVFRWRKLSNVEDVCSTLGTHFPRVSYCTYIEKKWWKKNKKSRSMPSSLLLVGPCLFYLFSAFSFLLRFFLKLEKLPKTLHFQVKKKLEHNSTIYWSQAYPSMNSAAIDGNSLTMTLTWVKVAWEIHRLLHLEIHLSHAPRVFRQNT